MASPVIFSCLWTALQPGTLLLSVSRAIPFDSLNLYAVLTECQLLVGGRIQDIRQPDAHTVVLVVYAQRAEHRLLISIDPQYARLHKITSS